MLKNPNQNIIKRMVWKNLKGNLGKNITYDIYDIHGWKFLF